ncbi:MAG: hypothetical protein D6686_06065 [Alphaproteobacteria bacterium]|nr:MAG: hypothetical protein D6686_06065 [Alphaproteobacteria bacterium]
MNMPDWVKPAIWGVIGGAAAAIVVGFVWGGWVTGSTAQRMEAASAESAILQAFTPLCVARAQDAPDKIALLKAEKSWKQDDFVIEAGWVANVGESFRADVARACARAILAAQQ